MVEGTSLHADQSTRFLWKDKRPKIHPLGLKWKLMLKLRIDFGLAVSQSPPCNLT